MMLSALPRVLGAGGPGAKRLTAKGADYMMRYSLIALLVGMSLAARACPPLWSSIRRCRRPRGRGSSVRFLPRAHRPAGSSSKVLRRARLSPGLPALGRERRSRRCVRELQSLAGAARARRQRRDPRAVPQGRRGHDPPVLRGEDDRRAGRPRRHVREGVLRAVRLDAPRRGPATLQPHGVVGAESARRIAIVSGASRDSTWARIRPRRTTTPRRS